MLASRSDLLSQVLGLIRLRGELILSLELAGPVALWLQPGAGWFHVLTEGRTQVLLGDGTTVPVVEGDLLVLPQGRGHVLGAQEATPVALRTVVERELREDSLTIRLGDGEPAARLVSGAFRFEGDNMPSMLAVLPPVIHIPRRLLGADGDWLGGLGLYLLAEARAPAPGAALMISRLIDVLVIRAFRIWVRTAPPEAKGWLGALADARIARALKAIHDAPFRRWTVAALADLAGMSRSNFAERFAALTGAPPLHYQTRWRLLLAADMLRRTDARVGDVGRRAGYESEAAFSRAFKAQFGVTPTAARQSAP